MIKLSFHILPWIKAIWDGTDPVLENYRTLGATKISLNIFN